MSNVDFKLTEDSNTFKTRLAYFEASIAAVEEAAKENVKSLRDELVKLKGGF